jgi:hypothetical protein
MRVIATLVTAQIAQSGVQIAATNDAKSSSRALDNPCQAMGMPQIEGQTSNIAIR